MIVIIMGNGMAIFIILYVYNVVFYNYSIDNSDMISVIMFMLIALAVHAEASGNV